MADPQVKVGNIIEEVELENLGFKALGAGHQRPKTLKLLPSPWSTDKLPPGSASLLSVGPRRGLLAAASPDKLVIASTEKVRKAFGGKAGANDVIEDFSPDTTLSVPQLRHVAFSADEDFLVTSAENGGGLTVYSLDDVLKGNIQPGMQVATDDTSVRALLPNPAPQQAHYMAVVLDSGRLDITDVTSGNARTVHNEGVSCASWSLKGKAFVAGFENGTASIHLVSSLDKVHGRVPRPPELTEDYAVAAVNWLNNEELLAVYTSSQEHLQGEAKYYFITTNKTYSTFTFREAQFLVFSSTNCPSRTFPSRYSMHRLRKWEPALEDMIMLTAAHSPDVGVAVRCKEPLVSTCPINEFVIPDLMDSRRAAVPPDHANSSDEVCDAALIGDALDLSPKEKVARPSPKLEEMNESPTPLPAYFLLTHEGLLAAYWVVSDKSLEAGTAYHLLESDDSSATVEKATPAAPASQPSPSVFGQTTPSQSSSFGNAQSTPAFGKPSFGAPAFGTPSAPTNNIGFGKPSLPSTTPSAPPPGSATFGTPGLGGHRSTFGAPSQIPRPNPFGSGGSASPQSTKIQNPFAAGGAASASDKSNPFAAAATKSNPFAAAAAAAKPGSGSSGASPFSSFSSNKDGQSGFGGLGQKSGSGFATLGQKSDSGFGGLGKPLSSFGSTVTVDSKATGPGSTLPSLSNTPAQQSSSMFGSNAPSSFPSFTSTQSGSTDVGERGREEATPTPQSQPHGLKETPGVSGGKFELKSTFKGDGSAKDDLPKPDTSGGSLFGNAFSSALTNTASKPPATPAPRPSIFASTTPATAPKPSHGLFGMRSDSATPKAAPPKSIPEDAPLPPDWTPAKPSKADDEIPPLAGSPPIKIEAPSSTGDMDDIPSSPLEDDEDDDLSNQDEEEYVSGEDEESDVESDEASEQSGESPTEEVKPTLFGKGAIAAPSLFGSAPTPAAQRTQGLSTSHFNAQFSGTTRDPLISSPSKSPTPQPIFSDLVDDEDERIRQELASEIEPSRTLAPFIARQEYTEAALNKTGHAAQIEIVYRDINSMVDTLGLNSRALQAFVDFHEQPQHEDQLGRSALEEVLDDGQYGSWYENWTLCEIEDLIELEDQLENELGSGGITKVVEKLSKVVRLIQENAKLQSKVNEERRRIINSKDPEKLEAIRKAALPKELADQQRALRRDYAQLLTQLGKAEDALILLRSKLASHNAKNGQTGAVPSVEAIKKTINKLIDITKEKDHDITRLEAQLRKTGLNVSENSRPVSASSRGAATPLRKSLAPKAETPFATPPTSWKKVSLRELNQVAMTPEQPDSPSRGYGLPQDGVSDGADLSHLADKVDDDLDKLRATARRRKAVADTLRGALADRGVKKTTVG